MEALEPRLFLSVSLDDSTGLLSIVGTRHADRIDVRFFSGGDAAGDFTAAYVTVNGRHKTFDHVAGLQVDAGGGDDIVVVTTDVGLDDPGSIHTTLMGGDGSDTIVGGWTSDLILGQDGRDYLASGVRGDDSVLGGDGVDVIGFDHADVYVCSGAGADYLYAASPHFEIFDHLTGGGADLNAPELMDGHPINSAIVGPDGVLVITGSPGDDNIDVQVRNGTLIVDILNDGGRGGFSSWVSEISGIRVVGGDGNDHIRVSGWDAPITLPVTLLGGAGDDELISDAGDDVILSGTGHDLIDARGGQNTTEASAHDIFVHSAGTVYLSGTQLVVNGTALSDGIYLARTTPDVLDVWVNGVRRSFEFGSIESIRIEGGDGDDQISLDLPPGATWRANTPMIVSGGEGDDVIIGGGGDDLLDGGAGDDVLQGFAGADTLIGGDGNDVIFSSGQGGQTFGGSGENLILAYRRGVGSMAVIGDDGTGEVEFRAEYGDDDAADGGGANGDDGGGSGSVTFIPTMDLASFSPRLVGFALTANGSVFGTNEEVVWEDVNA
jgi:Ca2+-binding RTX toxin-like protein